MPLSATARLAHGENVVFERAPRSSSDQWSRACRAWLASTWPSVQLATSKSAVGMKVIR
jgi:hypothetical protein